MKDDIHCDEISSLIDGEITEAKKKEEITKKINNDINKLLLRLIRVF